MKPPSVRRFPGRPAGQGFTLVELLVVMSILVAVAGLAAGMYYDAGDNATDELERVQMAELVQAIQRFKRDTGYYPRTGPFALDVNFDGTPNTSGHIDGATLTPAERAHFYSPANLGQLFTPPRLNSTVNTAQASLVPYDATLAPLGWQQPYPGRGWNGPYLRVKSGAMLYVDIGDDLRPDGSGDPTAVTTAALIDVPAVGAVREMPPVTTGNYSDCNVAPGPADCLFDFRSLPSDDRLYNAAVHEVGPHGRPFLLVVDPGPVRLIHFGPNGRYDSAENSTCNGTYDDIVVCL